MSENKRQKHADCIIAWANGAEIEFAYTANGPWYTIGNPSWEEDAFYRIAKPKRETIVYNGKVLPEPIGPDDDLTDVEKFYYASSDVILRAGGIIVETSWVCKEAAGTYHFTREDAEAWIGAGLIPS